MKHALLFFILTVFLLGCDAAPSPTSTLPTTIQTTTTAPKVPTATQSPTPSPNSSLWRGLTIAEENRCTPYDSDDYPYSPSVENAIVKEMGGIIYGPYTGTYFTNIKETDIEHIVARSEGHDSSLCEMDKDTKRSFASDVLNLTLASPSVNRHEKSAKDASEWLPAMNQCWFVDRIVQVRRKYSLNIDQSEADAIDAVLADCSSVDMVIMHPPEDMVPTEEPTPAAPTAAPTATVDALELWDDNDNGKISCAEAQKHGIAPVRLGDPAYEYMTDRDEDGIVCEN